MDPQDLRRAVQEEIRRILGDPSLRGARLIEAIAGLGSDHGLEPFRACLRALARIERPESVARPLIESIEQHRASLEMSLGRDPGLSVATLDVLHELEETIREPVFREGLDAWSAATFFADGRGPGPLDEALALEVRRGERFGRPLAVAILAPDPGVRAGEEMMSGAASALRDALRDTDHAARVMPDGFAVVLPCTPAEGGVKAADRLRRALQGSTGSRWSAGVAACPVLGWDPEVLAREAREALAAAREEGGGTVRAHRTERREHARRRDLGKALAATLRGEGGEYRAELEDLSVGGALMRMSEPVPPGSRLVIALRETSARPREVILASRVVRSEPILPDGPGEPFWRAGFEFGGDAEARYRIAGLLADLARRPEAGPEGRA